MSMPSIGNPSFSSEFQNPHVMMEQPSGGLGGFGPGFALGGDNVGAQWPAYPSQATLAQNDSFGEQSGPWASISNLIGSFGNFMQNSFGSIADAIASLGGGSTSSTGSYGTTGDDGYGYGAENGEYYGSGYPTNPYTTNAYNPQSCGQSFPSPLARPETQYSNADFHSIGDPHDAFDGSTSSGTSVNSSWDDKGLNSHADLVDSNAFRGGLRVSTTSGGALDSSGTHYNESANITTDGGRTQISYSKDGSYSVSHDGQAVSLTAGQPVTLGHGETVSLGSDGSLEFTDRNAKGGEISVNLATCDGNKGVSISGNAQNVALGGYLAGRAQHDSANDPASGGSSRITLPISRLPQTTAFRAPVLPTQVSLDTATGTGSTTSDPFAKFDWLQSA